MKKFDSGKACEVELLDDIDISPIFNIADLYKYYDTKGSLNDDSDLKQQYPKKQLDSVEQVLRSKVGGSTRGKEYKEYLIKRKD